MKLTALIAALALTLGTSAALAAPAAVSDSGVMADKSGMTLYIFDKDVPGVSNCAGGCAASWPPFLAGSDAAAEGDFTLVTRADGKAQWAFKEMPLYYWAGDKRPGQTNGDGVGGVWHVVK